MSVYSNCCRNCGGWEGIHHYETMQCPVGGVEAPIGRRQKYLSTTFDPQEDLVDGLRGRISNLEKRIAELEEKIKLLTDAVPSAKRV